MRWDTQLGGDDAFFEPIDPHAKHAQAMASGLWAIENQPFDIADPLINAADNSRSWAASFSIPSRRSI